MAKLNKKPGRQGRYWIQCVDRSGQNHAIFFYEHMSNKQLEEAVRHISTLENKGPAALEMPEMKKWLTNVSLPVHDRLVQIGLMPPFETNKSLRANEFAKGFGAVAAPVISFISAVILVLGFVLYGVVMLTREHAW